MVRGKIAAVLVVAVATLVTAGCGASVPEAQNEAATTTAPSTDGGGPADADVDEPADAGTDDGDADDALADGVEPRLVGVWELDHVRFFEDLLEEMGIGAVLGLEAEELCQTAEIRLTFDADGTMRYDGHAECDGGTVNGVQVLDANIDVAMTGNWSWADDELTITDVHEDSRFSGSEAELAEGLLSEQEKEGLDIDSGGIGFSGPWTEDGTEPLVFVDDDTITSPLPVGPVDVDYHFHRVG